MSAADPWPDIPVATRNVMRGNKGKDTKPELILRRWLHRQGYRYRVHVRRLPGSPDIVFQARRAIIQVHGCFWHQHPGCRQARIPLTRSDYWLTKLERNTRRDRRDEGLLEAAGWRVLVVWECELAAFGSLSDRVLSFLGPTTAPRISS